MAKHIPEGVGDRPFQIHGSPDVHDPTFAVELYPPGSTRWGANGVIDCEPRVVSGPHLCGKTAHIKWIKAQHNTVCERSTSRNFDPIWVAAPNRDSASSWTRTDIADAIGSVLDASDKTTLYSMLRSSRSTVPTSRRILIIDAADSLQDDVIRWILANIQQLLENPEVCQEKQVQILVAGSFTLNTLSGSPTSEYPLPTVPIPHFTPQSQKEFVNRRLASCGLSISANASRLLWDLTLGDKFLTQWLCHASVCAKTKKTARYLTKGDVETAQNAFITAKSTEGSIFRALGNVAHIINSSQNGEAILRFYNRDSDWDSLDKNVKRQLYTGGVVTTDCSGRVIPRAPLVCRALEQRLRQRKTCDDFARSWQLSGFVNDEDRMSWTTLTAKVCRAFLDNSVKRFYAGVGSVVGWNTVDVALESTTGDRLNIVWELELDPTWGIGQIVFVALTTLVEMRGHEVNEIFVWRTWNVGENHGYLESSISAP